MGVLRVRDSFMVPIHFAIMSRLLVFHARSLRWMGLRAGKCIMAGGLEHTKMGLLVVSLPLMIMKESPKGH